jgi:hypothetical protein
VVARAQAGLLSGGQLVPARATRYTRENYNGMKKIAALAAAWVLMMAMSSATAQAGAGPFNAASYPVTEKAEATNIHGFEIAGAVTICHKGTFNTGEEGAPNPTKAQETLEVHPIYSECKVEMGGMFKATVLTTGCNYVFHSAAPGTENGSMDVVCQAGKQIKVIPEGIAGCVITVGSQAGLKSIEYVNQAGPPVTVKVKAELSGIHYGASKPCGLVIEAASTGVYREGEEFAEGGAARLARPGHPATAVLKGFKQLSEPDAVEVGSRPHWYKNGSKLPQGAKTGTIGWGTLTLESSAGSTTCRSAEAANVENTAATGQQETVALTTWECKALGGKCAGSEARLSAKSLPWTATALEEGPGLFRQEFSGTELAGECYAGGKLTERLAFKTGPALGETGTWTPRVQNGTTPTKPSEVVFDSSSGHLYAESEGKAIAGTTKGKLKVVGYADNSPVPLITLGE